jgi:hypothetical protein
VHEEEDDQGGLSEGNEQGNDRIEDAKILEGYPSGEPSKDEKGDPDDDVDFG